MAGRTDASCRVLMLTQSYAPIIGGEERVVEELSGALVERGHEVVVATLQQPGSSPTNRPHGVRVRPLKAALARVPRVYSDEARRPAAPFPDPATVHDLRQVIRDEQPDVVHAHNWLVYSYLPLDRRQGPALLLSLHDYGLTCATKRFMRRDTTVCTGPGPAKCLDCAAHHYGAAKGVPIALATKSFGRVLRKHVDVFLPISDAVRVRAQLGLEDTYRVIPNFLSELPPPPGDDHRLRQLPDGPFILFFGDATVDKGAWELGRAYAQLDSPPPLVLVGRRFLPELEEHPGVVAVGPWPHELAIEAVRRALFTVVPSLWPEPFGLVALESAAAGKPVIASNTGGLTDVVVDGETGLLVSPGDREGLRSAIASLLCDGALRARLGAAAALRAAQFSPDAVVPAFEDAYRLALELRRGRPSSSFSRHVRTAGARP